MNKNGITQSSLKCMHHTFMFVQITNQSLSESKASKPWTLWTNFTKAGFPNIFKWVLDSKNGK